MMYQIEVTTHCNFECFYCAGRDMPQRHMAWDLFKTIIDGIPPGRHMVSLQGEGEPTTHPQFWAMAEAVRARGLVPFTITNAGQIDTDRIASTFPRIGVSIDTLDAVEAEHIGRHKLDRVLANVEALNARMSGKRIHIMTVNYGQPLDAVREFARARGYSHSVQALQAKPDYAHRYPQLLDAPAPRYTHRCRYLERPLKRYYDIEGRECLVPVLDNLGGGCRLADLREEVAEQLAVLGEADRADVGAEQPDVVLLEDAGLVEVHREVEAGLAAERGEHRVWALAGNDAFEYLDSEGLDVDGVRDFFIGHDRGGVGVYEDGADALLAHGFARLGPGVVELGRLADDDGAAPDDQDRARLRRAYEIPRPGGAGGGVGGAGQLWYPLR